MFCYPHQCGVVKVVNFCWSFPFRLLPKWQLPVVQLQMVKVSSLIPMVVCSWTWSYSHCLCVCFFVDYSSRKRPLDEGKGYLLFSCAGIRFQEQIKKNFCTHCYSIYSGFWFILTVLQLFSLSGRWSSSKEANCGRPSWRQSSGHRSSSDCKIGPCVSIVYEITFLYSMHAFVGSGSFRIAAMGLDYMFSITEVVIRLVLNW